MSNKWLVLTLHPRQHSHDVRPDIKLVKKSNDEYEWGYRRYRGPLDANFSWGVITKKFGYWIRKCTGGGES